MSFTLQNALSSVAPLGVLLPGLVVGLIAESPVLDRVAALLDRRGRPVAARLIGTLHGAVPLWTAALGARLTVDSYPLDPQWRLVLQQFFGLAMLLAVTLVVSRVAARLSTQFLRRYAETLPTASLISTLIGISIWTAALLVALELLGIAITPTLAALGVGGLAFALALQPTLQNLFSGLQIIASGQIKIGDYVQLESGKEGYVTDIPWRTTTTRDQSQHAVIVPNATLAQVSFTNFVFPAEQTSIAVALLVSYYADLEAVERLSLETARDALAECGGPLDGFEPYVRFTEFGNENVKLNVFLRAQNSVDPFKLRSDFIKRLHARQRSEGIRPPFPAMTASETTAPAPSATPSAPTAPPSAPSQSPLGGILSSVFGPPRAP